MKKVEITLNKENNKLYLNFLKLIRIINTQTSEIPMILETEEFLDEELDINGAGEN